VLQGQEAPAAAAKPSPRPRPDLERFLNSRLAGLDRQLGSLPRATLEAPLEELGAVAPCIPKAHLARHMRCVVGRRGRRGGAGGGGGGGKRAGGTAAPW
jgi:hypothetical protein